MIENEGKVKLKILSGQVADFLVFELKYDGNTDCSNFSGGYNLILKIYATAHTTKDVKDNIQVVSIDNLTTKIELR